MQPIAYAYTQFLSRCGELTGGLDNIEHLVTLALLGAAVALALSAGRRWVSAPVFCTGLLASLFVARLPWFLPLMGNPDEPQKEIRATVARAPYKEDKRRIDVSKL